MGVAGGPDLIQDGLVLALDASDRNSYVSGSTTWFDLSGLNRSGSLINGPTFNTGSLGSIVFDGINDYVSITSSICIGVGFSGTVEVVTTCTGSLVFNERTSGRHGDGYFTVSNSGSLQIGFNAVPDIPYVYFLTSSISGNLNQINHYIASYTIPLVSTGSMSGILGTNGVFEIVSSSIVVAVGQQGNFTNIDIARQRNFTFGTTYSSPGRVFFVRIYNRRLSQSEMLQNYNATKTRFGL